MNAIKNLSVSILLIFAFTVSQAQESRLQQETLLPSEPLLSPRFQLSREVTVKLMWEATSPNGAYASLIRRDAGATTSFTYWLEVRETGNEPDDHDIVFRADKTNPPIISWLDQDTLEICHTDARIWHYTSFKDLFFGDVWVPITIELAKRSNC